MTTPHFLILHKCHSAFIAFSPRKYQDSFWKPKVKNSYFVGDGKPTVSDLIVALVALTNLMEANKISPRKMAAVN